MAKVWCVDVSEYQGASLDFGRIEAEGFGCVMIKGSGSKNPMKGSLYLDPYFMVNAVKANAQPNLCKMVYHYLSAHTETPVAQAGLLMDLLAMGISGDSLAPGNWGASVDVEDDTLDIGFLEDFILAWNTLTNKAPIFLYSNANFWKTKMSKAKFTKALYPNIHLWHSHWVPKAIREDPAYDYASLQAKLIKPEWWTPGYGGFDRATILQFTDQALVDGRRVDASIFNGDKSQLRSLLV